MSDPIDPLQRLQRDVEAKLNSEAYYNDVYISVVRPREKESGTVIQDKINQALAGKAKKNGKAGACIQILMPLLDMPERDSSPRFIPSLILRVQEFPAINMGADGSRKPVEEIAMRTACLLHQWIPGNGIGQLGGGRDLWTPSLEFDPLLTIDLRFTGSFGVDVIPQVQTPSFSGSAASLWIGCNTPGATIYYTLDHSFPGGGNAAASVYGYVLAADDGVIITSEEGIGTSLAEPLTVPAGALVRAAAYHPDKPGSNVATYQN